MIIHNLSKEQLFCILIKLNGHFDGNVKFREDTPSPVNKKGTKWRVLLGVSSNKGKGAKVSKRYSFNGYEGERRSCYACWHVHGRFIDMVIDDGGYVGPTLVNKHPIKTHEDNWKDAERSPMFGLMESDMCDC